MSHPVYDKHNPKSIQNLFSSIAERYDVGNALLSMNLHRSWNRRLARLIATRKPDVLLDLCCGTGDIAFTYLDSAPERPQRVYMIDFCEEMLEQAKRKAASKCSQKVDMIFRVGDAQALDLPDASVDAITIAYGIRNVQQPERCIAEAYRVLKPSGYLAILELTRPRNPVMRLGHSFYLKTCVPLIGRWLTKNQQAYEYLQRSIHHFIPPESIQSMLNQAGFQQTTVKRLSLGIATLVSGSKE